MASWLRDNGVVCVHTTLTPTKTVRPARRSPAPAALGTEDVRLIGIDTPEVFGGRECGGRKASRSKKRMLDPGDRVKLIRDPSQDNRDRYGRILRYVERSSKDVGKRQIAKGWARVYVFESPFRRLKAYRKARKHARSDGRGVWSLCGGNFHQPT